MSELSDPEHAALLVRIAAGDLDALGVLWREVAQHVVRFVANRLGRPIDDPDVEDVASETLHRILGSAGTYAGGSKTLTWVLGIAKNVLRERAKDRLPLADPNGSPVADHGVDQELFPIPLEELEPLIKDLLDELPAAQRQALLRDLEHSDKEEAREGLHGRDAAAHRQNVHRAREFIVKRVSTDDKYEKLRPWLRT